MAAIVLLIGGGCTCGPRTVLTTAVLSDDAELLATQMLKPGVEGEACAWHAVWNGGRDIGSLALRRALAQAPDATLLRDARVATSRRGLGLVVRDCARVSGDAARGIRSVVLPALGTGHEGHH
jgi:hypothetical protein